MALIDLFCVPANGDRVMVTHVENPEHFYITRQPPDSRMKSIQKSIGSLFVQGLSKQIKLVTIGMYHSFIRYFLRQIQEYTSLLTIVHVLVPSIGPMLSLGYLF